MKVFWNYNSFDESEYSITNKLYLLKLIVMAQKQLIQEPAYGALI